MKPPLAPASASIDQETTREFLGEIRAIGLMLCVRLGGVEQQRVVAYDCEEGWLVKQLIGESGLLVIDNHGDPTKAEVATRRMTGLVSAEIVPQK